MEDFKAIGVVVPRDRRSLGIQVGLAYQPWQTAATGDVGGSAGGGVRNVVFGRVRAEGGHAIVVVSHDISDDECRLVAVDLQKAEHTAIRTTGQGAGAFHQLEAEFDVRADAIKEVHLQTRPYEWVTFEDIPLPPAEAPPAAK